ncbi:MAG: class I SAM-dependent methyltransferase [Gemmatimonadota bacterium]
MIRRLNWGCGGAGEPGWINSDVKEGPRIDISADIRGGLPLEEGSIDYAVSIHALQEIPYPDLVPVLQELRRVLKNDGVLRLGLPDLDLAIRAYLDGDPHYFAIPDDDAANLGAKFVTQIVWYGYSRTPFTFDFARGALGKARFRSVVRCGFQQTASRFPKIVELDNREEESLFVEAVK